eukprot:83706-Amphidinium_carterae.1
MQNVFGAHSTRHIGTACDSDLTHCMQHLITKAIRKELPGLHCVCDRNTSYLAFGSSAWWV